MNSNSHKHILSIFICIIFAAITSSAQVYIGGAQTNGSKSNNIITAVPFLLVTPDARAGGMGNTGVATPGDINSSSINPAKLAFLISSYGVGVSYSPWLKNLIPDMSLSFISGYSKLDERNTLGASLRYFSLGEVELTDINQQTLGFVNPSEFSVDISYARSFGPEFSLGSTVRFISSNLTAGQAVSGQLSKAGNAVAMDVGGLYKTTSVLFGKEAIISGGINISNIGTKISYSEGGQKYFLPANLKIGGATQLFVDEYNTFTFALDLNKLLVPTQPDYDLNGQIIKGKDPDRSVPAGIFGSFSDAPGGFSEEIKEIGISTGIEYWYNQQFAMRLGYNYENPAKGDSNYVTLGLGLKYNAFNIDFSYLIADDRRSPLANTLRFGLLFNFKGAADK